MYKHLKTIVIALALVILGAGIAVPVLAAASDNASAQMPSEQTVSEETAVMEVEEQEDSPSMAAEKGSKAMSAAIVVGLAAAVGAIAMGLAISKSVEGVARQPEASGKIQTMLMLGLVFIETAIIYALIVAILIIFVL